MRDGDFSQSHNGELDQETDLMIINGNTCRQTRCSMSIFLDGHVAGSQPVLSIDVLGERMSINIAGQTSAIEPHIYVTVPLPVRDWRLLNGFTFDDSFPGAVCLAWCINPQMVDMESFKCVVRTRSSRTFSVELAATLTCYDFSDSGVPVSISTDEHFTLDSISVGIPSNSTSPVEDASRLLAHHLDPETVLIPTLHCRHETGTVNLLAYEVHFPTAS